MTITTRAMILLMSLAMAGVVSAQTDDAASRQALLERAQKAELPGAWVPAPVALPSHFAAAYAQRMCSAIFIAGMDPKLARETLGDRNALVSIAQRVKMREPVVDRAGSEVRVQTQTGITRIARRLGSQGCVIVPEDGSRIGFVPTKVVPNLPEASSTLWPMGDRLPAEKPRGYDAAKVVAALDAAFAPDEAMTQAFVVTWKGQLIGERYGLGATADTPLEGWSMGKSIVATLLGVLMQQGTYSLDQPAPIPEWQTPGDPRQAIRIRDLMNMSGGLRIRAEQDPEYVYDGRLPDHWYYYTAPNAFAYAASRPQEWLPGTIGRYRNTDPVLSSYLVRLAVERKGGDYHSFPQRALFDRIGIRTAVLETDAAGNFVTQGAELLSGRDWARLANLYLQDGTWDGKRILPEGFVKFVSTPAPAWVADGRNIYGGFFWLNTDGGFAAPKDAYFMAGAGGQYTFIIPSHDLVVARLGRYAGTNSANASLNRALALLMEAVPANNAKAAPAKDELITLEKSAYEAWKSKDAKFWDTFLSEKFVGYGSSGKLDKASATKEYTGADCEIKSYALSDEQMKPLGNDAALITHKTTVDGTCGGRKLPANSWAAGVYVRDGDEWKGAFHAEAAIVDPKAAPAKPVEAPAKAEVKPADRDARTDALLAIEKTVWEAWRAHDARKLEDLTASDISFINIFGTHFATKTDALKDWSAPGCDAKSVGVTDAAATMLSPTVGILTFKGSADGTCYGQKVGPIWGTSVYVKDGDAWKWTFGINVPARR